MVSERVSILLDIESSYNSLAIDLECLAELSNVFCSTTGDRRIADHLGWLVEEHMERHLSEMRDSLNKFRVLEGLPGRV